MCKYCDVYALSPIAFRNVGKYLYQTFQVIIKFEYSQQRQKIALPFSSWSNKYVEQVPPSHNNYWCPSMFFASSISLGLHAI